MYDVIVVGARCAGSPLAMLLAREGYRVLLVDKGTFPSDVLSNHFLWPRAVTYLTQWGFKEQMLASDCPIFDQIHVDRDGISIDGYPTMAALRNRFEKLHGCQERERPDDDYMNASWPARRRVLDSMLLEGALEAGVEFRDRFRVLDLLWEGDAVCGIRGQTPTGNKVEERATLVVGADGRYSTIARLVDTPKYNVHPECTLCYITYFSGLDVPGPGLRIHLRGRMEVVTHPTNFGLTLALVSGPREWFKSFRANVEGNFMKGFHLAAPDIAELIETQGRREERFLGTVDQAAFMRRPYGPGWCLVGDAGMQVDQCTAIGITQAFRDATLAADKISDGLAGRQPLEEALAEFAQRRDEDSLEYFQFVCQTAKMCRPTEEVLSLFGAMASPENAPAREQFYDTFASNSNPQNFFAPDNLSAILSRADGREPWKEPENARRLALCSENPF